MAKRFRPSATDRTSSWMPACGSRAISAIPGRSTMRAIWRVRKSIGPRRGPPAMCAFFRASVVPGFRRQSWLSALVTGWQAPCVRAAAGMALFTIGRYFFRERRSMNLLAAVALGFLLFDPEQLFEASFQLTFLAVGFLAAFAAPLIAATSGPLARGLRGLADADRDPRLAPRVAQFRVEMRLLAETIWRLTRVPEAAARLAVAAVAAVV